jgi:hypothetical protein
MSGFSVVPLNPWRGGDDNRVPSQSAMGVHTGLSTNTTPLTVLLRVFLAVPFNPMREGADSMGFNRFVRKLHYRTHACIIHVLHVVLINPPRGGNDNRGPKMSIKKSRF